MAQRKIDWNLELILLTTLLNLIGYFFLASGYSIFLLVVAIGGFCMLLWMCLSHEHKFTETTLTFRAGPFRQAIPLVDIFEVMPTHDGVPKSRGAVRVRYYTNGFAGDSFMMIPRNQSEFRTEMASRCPHLEASGDGLKRAASTKATT
jgi:hypothetical protein